MILIPLGHEHTSVRRKPWVTFGLMIACTFVLLGLYATDAGDTSAPRDAQSEVILYWQQHPYLDVPEVVGRGLSMHFDEEELPAFLEGLRSAAGPPPPPEVVAEQEAELDRLVARAESASEDAFGAYSRFGLVPSDITLVGLVAHMFMHAGLFHLLGNLLILYLAGPFIEDVWGRPLYTGFYLVSGVAAALAHVAAAPSSHVPLVGASGAIAGVMGAFLVRFWSTRIEFFYMVGFFARGTFWAPAWFMLPLWLGEQVFFGLMFSGLGGESGVAYWAHVGGFVFGAISASLLKVFKTEEKVIQPSLDEKVAPTVALADPRVEEAQAARAAGDPRKAWEILGTVLRERPEDRDACLTLWDIALEQGWCAQGAGALLQVIRLELRGGEDELACEHWQELAEKCGEAVPEPALVTRLVLLLVDRQRLNHAASLARRAAQRGLQAFKTPQLVKLALQLKTADPELAARLADEASLRPDIDPSSQESLQRLSATASVSTRA